MINKKMRVGVIGLGHQSIEDHIPALKESKDAELVAVAEIDEKKIERVFGAK